MSFERWLEINFKDVFCDSMIRVIVQYKVTILQGYKLFPVIFKSKSDFFFTEIRSLKLRSDYDLRVNWTQGS